MLRSTGFFRGIDCPFYAEHREGKGTKNGCNRPYCHFRHSRPSYGAPADEQGYDPFKPGVLRPQVQQNGKPDDSGDLSGALELVNRAIEEVRGEVEREKRKLSCIGDEPYDPSESTSFSSSDRFKSKMPASHLAYDPGSYQMASEGYTPTLGCSKYTLDSDTPRNNSNSMEYVPTLVKKPRTLGHQASSCKYTVDISRPSTDMEYDPLSNYSAGIASKNKKDKKHKDGFVQMEGSKTYKVPGSDVSDEDCVTGAEKAPHRSVDFKKYTVSESDGESSGTEYRPTSLSHLQQRKTQRNKEEVGGHAGVPEGLKRKSSLDQKKTASQRSHEKGGKSDKVHKPAKESGKISVGGSNKEKQHCSKKENKSHVKRDDRKDTDKVRTSDKGQTAGGGKKSDSKITTVVKGKTDPSKQETKHVENGARESKKARMSDKSSSNKSCSTNSKDKTKQAVSSANGKRLEDKRPSLNLSHAELFGDESPEEAEAFEVDDEEPEETLVRKSADAFRRGRPSKRKASEMTSVSTDDEEGSRASKNTAASLGIDLSGFQDDLDFESDPMEECLRIFNESTHVKKEDKGRQAKQPSQDSEEERSTENTLTTLFPGQKRRVSHFSAKGIDDAPSKPVLQPYKRLSAQEVCYRRLHVAQQQAAQLSAAAKAAKSNNLGFSGEKKRIAHRPNPQITPLKTIVKAGAGGGSSQGQSQSHLPVKAQTTAGIISKTTSTVVQKRVAHTPTMKSSSLKRPIIPTEFGAKIPTNIRQRYLNTFIDECVKFCPSEDVAFQMALDEEKLVYDRSSSKNIYLNVAVNTLKKLRSRSSSCPSPVTKEAGSLASRRAQSHQQVLGGRLAATTSFTVNRMGRQQEEKLTGARLYRKLKVYLMTEEQLQEHGYPRSNPEAPGRAVLYNLPEKKPASDRDKICCRCGAEYKVNANGNCVRKEECSFHWGQLRRHKVAGGWETSYRCCAAAVGAPGCQVSKQHVQDGRKASLEGYVATFSKDLPPDGNAGVFALDCEMCYTKQGLELTRVTVIDSEMKVIYDTFVKPESQVVDYNTRFSGVTEEDLENTTISLRDVQAVLLSLFSAESILIGHSLESDLLALKLIHSSVVDTSFVFPHRLGLPYKRALRSLMADHLKRIIQDNVEGHDSSEDAAACMELMVWKIREDAKVKR
uniref:REX1, RNA exonuclease 1 homolog n=1 Tax=Tetraodon nigroviridis TaxID=99883 RepID=H3BY62_TETNG